MKRAIFPITAVLATPAAAQMAAEQVQTMITSDTTEAGFEPAVAEAIATFFTSRITEEEASTVLATAGLDAQQEALAQMADYIKAVSRTVEASE